MDLGDFHVKRRKKGLQQRVNVAAQQTTHESILAEWLLMQLAWGIFSTAQVQTCAHLAVQDLEQCGLKPGSLPELDVLARSGTFGKHLNNVHRDIMTAVKDKATFEPSEYCLPFKQFGEQPQLINLPHEHLAHLHSTYPQSFKTQVLPDTCNLHEFWQELEGFPGLEGVDFRGSPGNLIPFAMHGDEVPITGVGKVWAKCALTFQFFSVVASTTGLATKSLMFWIWAVFEKMCEPGEQGTIETFMQIMTWSWAALYEGRWPTHDWRGIKWLLLNLLLYFCSPVSDM